jgi:SAM-dependent methyltransferase
VSDDWGAGTYELSAKQLEPAAAGAVGLAGIDATTRVVDVCCGTGNVSALTVAAGAPTTGLDFTPRLLEVARARVPAAEFVLGDATAMPFADDAFDVAISVFGVIFAPAQEVVAELLRVVRPGGRIVLTAWQDGGLIFESGGLLRAALAESAPPTDDAPPPPHTRWSDPDLLRGLFAPHRVTVHEGRLPFRNTSPQAAADDLFDHQPMWLAAGRALAPERYARARADSAALFAERNEDPAAWQSTSGYVSAVVDVA